MATPQQIRDAVDAKVDLILPAVQTRQASFLPANGQYWQGLKTHTVEPADGVEIAPDIGTKTPTDQTDAPYPLTIRNTAMPMAIEIDVYDGPYGKGYQVILFVKIVDIVWMRVFQFGAETYRVRAWNKFSETQR